MIRIITFVYTVLFASPVYAVCTQPDAQGYCSDQVMRLELKRNVSAQARVNIGIGTTLVIALPRNTALTDPSSLALPKRSAFAFRFNKKVAPTKILITTKKDTRGRSVAGQTTNLHFAVAGEAIVLNIKAVEAEGCSRLELDFPELNAEQDRIDTMRAEIRAELEAELAKQRANIGKTSRQLAKRQLIDAALKRLTCSTALERGFDQALILISKRICALGDDILIEVTLHNGRRSDFELRDIVVEGEWGSGQRPLPFDVGWMATKANQTITDPLKLPYDATVRGIFLIEPPAGERPDSYSITVREHGGLKRVSTASDIEF